MVTKNSIAIIPARGGSKRIPKKNIKPFAGKPMIAWSIEAALMSEKFDRVFVSTDSEEIATVAINSGADVPFLREKCADDYSTASEVTIHALEQIHEKLNESYQVVTQLMPNCPLRDAKLIQSMYDDFFAHDYEFLLSCFKFGWDNPWWAVELDPEKKPIKLFPDAFKARSQDMAELFCPTGAIWIAKTASLMQSKTFYGPEHRFYPIPWKNSADIDTQDDWQMAEALFYFNQTSKKSYEKKVKNDCVAG